MSRRAVNVAGQGQDALLLLLLLLLVLQSVRQKMSAQGSVVPVSEPTPFLVRLSLERAR